MEYISYNFGMPMMDEIRDRLNDSPFKPFALRTADGREYLVPTVDHTYLPPHGKRVFVADDDGTTVGLAPLLIAGIVYDLPARRGRAGRRKS